MRTVLVASLLFAGCSSSSPSSPVASDAGADVTDATTARDVLVQGDANVPLSDSSLPGKPDAVSQCDLLKQKVMQLAGPAQACCPSCAPAQCTATTNGICCPISVDTSSVQAVNDYDQAVMTYANQCHPDCSGTICSGAPSGICSGGGTTGICQ